MAPRTSTGEYFGKGKWALPEVPKENWVCIGTQDNRAPESICEMCETQKIRNVHIMRHDDYPAPLKVGCDCAGKMQGDHAKARRRDAMISKELDYWNDYMDENKWRDFLGHYERRFNSYRIAIVPDFGGQNLFVFKAGRPIKRAYRLTDRHTARVQGFQAIWDDILRKYQ